MNSSQVQAPKLGDTWASGCHSSLQAERDGRGSPRFSPNGVKSLNFSDLQSLGIFCLLLCFSSYPVKMFQELKLLFFFFLNSEAHSLFLFYSHAILYIGSKAAGPSDLCVPFLSLPGRHDRPVLIQAASLYSVANEDLCNSHFLCKHCKHTQC